MTEPTPDTQAQLPTLAAEIWVAVKADFTELKQGFIDGSKQAVTGASTELNKLPAAAGDVGTKSGTAYAKGVTDKLPTITTAATTEANKLPTVMASVGDKSAKALTNPFYGALRDVATDTTDTIGKAGEEGGRKGGERGGRAFGDSINPMIRSSMREGTDAIAQQLGVWPELLDPFREGLDRVFESLTDKLPQAAATGGAAMETTLTADAAAAGATMTTEMEAAGTASAAGFAKAFSTLVLPEVILPVGISIIGGGAIADWLGKQLGLPDRKTPLPQAIMEAPGKIWGMISGDLDPTTGKPYTQPIPPAPPPPVTSAPPPPGYKRTKDDPNRYEPLQPGDPGYGVPPPPPGVLGAAVPVPAAIPIGPQPWFTGAKPPKGTKDEPVHTKSADDEGVVKPDHHGAGGRSDHESRGDESDVDAHLKKITDEIERSQGGTTGSAGGSGIDEWLLSQIPPGHYLHPGMAGDPDITKGLGDCTSAIEDLIDLLEGKSTSGRTLSTGSAASILPQLGFIPNTTGANVPGAFNIGFNSEHMQATLPDDTNFNYGSDAAAQAGGRAGGGAFDPSQGFTQHYYLPDKGVTQHGPKGSKDDPVHTKDADADKKKDQEDKNAKDLGKGLVDGVFQALGIDGSVFSDFRDWGIWKTGAAAVTDVGKYAQSITPAKGSDAEKFFAGIPAGVRAALGLPALKEDAGQDANAGTPDPVGPDPTSSVTGALANVTKDGGKPPVKDGGPVNSGNDQRRYDIKHNYNAPQPYPLPAMTGVPGHP